jgi:hypothetical protein
MGRLIWDRGGGMDEDRGDVEQTEFGMLVLYQVLKFLIRSKVLIINHFQSFFLPMPLAVAGIHRSISLARTPCSGCSIQRQDASVRLHAIPALRAMMRSAPTPFSKDPFQRNQNNFPVTKGARL